MSFSEILSEAQNCKYKVNTLRVRRISTIHAFSVAILAPFFVQLIQTSDWDQNSGVRLVFGLSKKTERKTNPKSEVSQCFESVCFHWMCNNAAEVAVQKWRWLRNLILDLLAVFVQEVPEELLCNICYAHMKSVMFLPCRHQSCRLEKQPSKLQGVLKDRCILFSWCLLEILKYVNKNSRRCCLENDEWWFYVSSSNFSVG